MTTSQPAESGSDALAVAKANADAIAQRFVESNTLTPAERSNLVYDLKAAVAQVDAIERGQA